MALLALIYVPVKVIRYGGYVGSEARLAIIARVRQYRLFRKPKAVPKDWYKKPSEKGIGVKYINPRNPTEGTYIRIQSANPKSRFPWQRRDYVKWQRDGSPLDKYGNAVSSDSEAAHIPFDEFIFKPELFR